MISFLFLVQLLLSWSKSSITLAFLPLQAKALRLRAVNSKQAHGTFSTHSQSKARTIINSSKGTNEFSPTSDPKQNVIYSDTSVINGNDSTFRSRRNVAKIEKFARLPVWPAWNGVFIFLLSKILGEEIGAKVEDAIGGRVCPNFFAPRETSPFIMLVHHRHSFAPWDPLRFIQRTFFPEGFPAHPHRGFITVTYILKGGFTHRDSIGMKQVYGAESRHNGKHTQWLTTGAGMLHEEMFDIQPDETGWLKFLQPSSQELYQLWLNLPSLRKMCAPKIELLGGDDETPTVITEQMNDGGEMAKTKTIIICGEHGGRKGSIETASDVTILHVQMDRGSTWRHQMPESHKTAIMYMRKGSTQIGDTRIPPHYTAYLSPNEVDLVVNASDDDDETDFLLLSGAPLNEPVAAQGSMVMNSYDEINEAYGDYQLLRMGRPWSHKLSDDEWKNHILQFPSMYKGKVEN